MRKKERIQEKSSTDIQVLGKTRALKNHNDGFCILWSIIYKLPVLHITAKNTISSIWWIFYLPCSLWFLFISAFSTVKIKLGNTLSIATTGDIWNAMFWLKYYLRWQHIFMFHGRKPPELFIKRNISFHLLWHTNTGKVTFKWDKWDLFLDNFLIFQWEIYFWLITSKNREFIVSHSLIFLWQFFLM